MPLPEQTIEALKAPERSLMAQFREAVSLEQTYEMELSPRPPTDFIAKEEREACMLTEEGSVLLGIYEQMYHIISGIGVRDTFQSMFDQLSEHKFDRNVGSEKNF